MKQEINEWYKPDQLHLRDHIIKVLNAKRPNGKYIASRTIRKLAKELPYIECTDSEGNNRICTKLPQVIWQHLYGSF